MASWSILLHPPSDFIGLFLTGSTKQSYGNLRKKIDMYLENPTFSEKLLRDFINAWNETAEAFEHLDDSIPLCKLVLKYLRYRLCDNTVTGFLRLTHLLNALMRSGGIRAHVLIGGQQFLQTLTYRTSYYKSRGNKEANNAADFAYKCLSDWTKGLEERSDIFPYYGWELKELKGTTSGFDGVEEQQFEVTSLEIASIEIDPNYRLESLLESAEATAEEKPSAYELQQSSSDKPQEESPAPAPAQPAPESQKKKKNPNFY